MEACFLVYSYWPKMARYYSRETHRALLTLDRLSSFGLGRPCGIHDEECVVHFRFVTCVLTFGLASTSSY